MKKITMNLIILIFIYLVIRGNYIAKALNLKNIYLSSKVK